MEAIRRWSKEGMKSRAPLPRDGRYTKISDERPDGHLVFAAPLPSSDAAV